MLLFFFFFFFQAEDGIRDLTVTGVQTCALPISRCARLRRTGLPIPAGPRRGGDAGMSGSKQQQVSELLHEAAETHHRVFRIVDGADDDWATWYADWLVNLSGLPALLGAKPARSELTYLLVGLDRQYAAE